MWYEIRYMYVRRMRYEVCGMINQVHVCEKNEV